MVISKSVLIAALAKVKPGLSSKEFIEQSTSFAFLGDRVVTYNDEVSISHPIEGMDITGAIQAEPLYSLLSKITDDKIKITVNGKELMVKAGAVKAGFALQEEIKLPLEEVDVKKKWKILSNPKALLKGLKFVSFTCSKDVTRPVLTCVNVLQSGELQATDNFRVTTYNTDPLPVKGFLLPVNALNVLVGYPVRDIAKTSGWVHFRTDDGTILSARTYKEDFPNVNAHMKVKGHALPLPNTLDEMVERSLVVTKSEVLINSVVEIALSDGLLKVSGKADFGWFSEVKKIKYTGTSFIFIINPLFLIDIAQESEWEATISKKADRVLFAGKKWEHLLMLQA